MLWASTSPTLTLSGMGAWGPGIFSNDTSADIRGDFRELLEDGLTPEQATERLIQGAGNAVDDQDDATSFWTGLAAVQMALRVLQPRVRDRAISLIDSGGDLALWDDRKVAAKRKAVLERLRSQLLGPQKAAVKVRRPKRIPSPVKAGDVFLLTLDDGRRARFRVMGMNEHRMGDFPIVELIDDRGRPFRQYYKNPDAMNRRHPWARYHVVSSRLKDLPADATITVVGSAQVEPTAEAFTYTSWRNLTTDAQRLLDEPAAQP
jgi:hypothetical protein